MCQKLQICKKSKYIEHQIKNIKFLRALNDVFVASLWIPLKNVHFLRGQKRDGDKGPEKNVIWGKQFP